MARHGLKRIACTLCATLGLGGPALAESAVTNLHAYYAKLEAALVARGALRQDRAAGAHDAAALERDFIDVALFNEYGSGRLTGGEGRRASKPLLRWEEPVRMQVIFGRSVGKAQRLADRKAITAYTRKLSGITGLPISANARGANFHVLVVNDAERQSLGPQLEALIPGISPWMVRTITRMRANHLCMVVAEPYPDPRKGYRRAVAILRAEQSDRLRASCIEEELAQGLGLPNDCKDARPSIFNDDNEYALLTRRDELLLEMLYHPDLASGMTLAEARPRITRLARTLAAR